ncbi:TonB family protein [Glaciecola sp. XM2]|jgi:TonB family protein|uniref:energy transducer TonB n=1 Tax=Glaciecola sp. XM2 TaxID=1914931 RepID=UPI001BDF0E52|nr:energy transducer TonB [Glaciecola sp. XM2]MBT1449805.1 TonB family protein [Glaciecola sp. XM2]
MNIKTLSLISAALIMSFAHLTAVAQDADFPCDDMAQAALSQTPSDKVTRITSFTPPEVLERPRMRFPTEALRNGAEGWVQMSYVIDEEGKVVDPVVEDFSGHRAFRSSALRALKNTRYTPAMKDGKPTEVCHQSIRFDFTIGGATGATRSFVYQYKKAEDLFQNGDIEAAEVLVEKMRDNKNRNRYENAWLWNLDALIAAKKDDQVRIARSLSRAISSSRSHDEEHKTFSDDYKANLYQRLFVARTNLKQYALALQTYDDIKSLPNSDELIKPLQPMLAHIEEVSASDKNIAVAITLDEDDQYFHRLLRNKFAFADIQGELETVEVRCETRREKFTIAEDHIWTIPKSWGNCQVFIQGEAQTTFNLVEVAEA